MKKKIFIPTNEIPEEIETSFTFIIPLLGVLDGSEGTIYEFGVGIYSTPLLHFYSMEHHGKIISIEQNKEWYERMRDMYSDECHEFILDSYQNIDIKHCGVLFIDNEIGDRKNIAVKYRDVADYVILHDSDECWEPVFRYSEIYPYFTHRFDYNKVKPNTVILSNKKALSFL